MPARLDRSVLDAAAPEVRAVLLAAYLRDKASEVTGALPAPGQSLLSLGLDSLAAAELEAAVAADLGVELTAAALLDGATVESLSSDLLIALDLGATPGLGSAAAPDVFPLSQGQRALWFLEQAAPGRGVYNLAVAARVDGPLDVAALRRGVERLAIRHAALRASVVCIEGEPIQRVAPSRRPDLEELDAAAWDAGVLAARLAEEAWRPFDLDGGQLLRLRLFHGAGGASILSFVVHHLVADFTSLAVLVRELAALYGEEIGGPPAILPSLPFGYADFVRWEQQRLASEGDRLCEHWRQRLAGLPDLALPTDHPRPRVQTYRGAAQVRALPVALADAVRALAAASGATPFMVLLAAFAAQLHRYSSQEDFAIGSPAAGRAVPGFAGVVGYFVNPLPLRAELAGVPPFAELLQRTRLTTLAALAHADLPIQQMAERLRPAREADRPPFFQVMLALHGGRPEDDPGLGAFALGMAGARLDLGGLHLESLNLVERRTPFDLALRLAPLPGGGLGATLEHDADLFDAATGCRLLGHFASLLAAAVGEPRGSIAALPLLTPAERAQLLVEWNDSGDAPPRCPLLPEAFAEQVRRTPEAVALVAGDERWTYGALGAGAGRLARQLVRMGVGPEIRVGVCLDRSPALVTSLLAVLAAGGTYVPLHPADPRERLAALLEDSGARLLLADAAAPADLGGPDLPRLDPRHVATALDGSMPEGLAAPENLAYLIYTSGSTGMPKAVAIEHRAAAAFLSWTASVFTPDELAGVLFATSIGFDLSVFELFVPLARGGRVILAANALELPGLPAAGEVTLINTVPSAMAELVRGGLPPSVATVNLAGEPIPPALVGALYASPGVSRVFNLYGPSEATTYSTWALLGRGAGAPPIGRPITGTRAHLLDGRGELVPAGVPGEIWLGGAGLARGYLGRPELTAERFAPDPFSPTPGERLYRTGDLARRRRDGTLEFLGRIDHQVKVRGFRIEPGEIEAALGRHPGIREAVVTARGEADGGRRLVAYVVPREPDAGPSAAALRAVLARTLPAYMIPSAFVMLEALPRSPNGKLDRRALPAPPPPGESGGGGAAAPRDPVEEVLGEIWADLLGVARVAAEDRFFDLGGHSLLATRLVRRVRETLGVELPVTAVFEAPALADLARRVRGADSEPAAPLAPVPRTGDLPLSFAQQRLWLLDQLEPGVYNVPGGLRLQGPLVGSALERALAAIVERHEALRTTFPAAAGQPRQRIAPPGPWTLPRIDLRGLPDRARAAAAFTMAAAAARRPFDLVRGPLLRASLVRLASADHLLLVTLHHIVADGWSLGVLLGELAVLYTAFVAGEASPLPALPVQYADWAVWQRGWLEGDALAPLLAWWRACLGTAPPVLELPADRPRAPFGRRRGGQRPLHVPAPVVEGLRRACRASGATLFMGLLAAFDVLLARHAHARDLVVGVPVANRGRREIEPLIGLFVNTLVLRTGVADDPPFGILLARVRAAAVGAWAHQDLPFEILVQELAPERRPGQSPLFQVLLSLQGAQPLPRLPGLRCQPFEVFNGESKFDVSLLLAEGEDGLSGTLTYDASLFDAVTVDHWIARLSRLIAGAIADPEARLSRLPLLSAAELHQVLVGWNAAGGDAGDAGDAGPGAPCLHQRFAAQAARTPDVPAVVAAGASLTFAELDRRANGLAHQLRRIGVGNDSIVGLCAGRAPELLIGILGIWKAGGAYLPLDPAQPRQRLAAILADAAARTVVAGRAWRDVVPPGLEVVVLATGAPPATDCDEPPGAPASPDQLAYVIYTSGSTGRPKGTLISHGAVINLMAALDRAVYDALGEAPRVGLNASFAFDASVKQIVQVVRGRTLAIVPAEARLDGRLLARFLASHQVDVLDCTPSQLRALLDSGLGRWPRPIALLLGGEAIDGTLWRRLAADPIPTAFNVYGPTECTVDAVVCRLAEMPDGPVLGRPIAGVSVFVVDADLEPLPPGMVGELCIGGAGVARGYHRLAALTAERFVPDPWSRRPGARLYRSGDLARWRRDGRLEFLGRDDQQVKVRGFRVEPAEIEAALLLRPEVGQAVVVPHQGEPGPVRLVAYLTAAGSATPDAGTLRAHLREILPEPLVPDAFVVLDSLPLAASGKVDRAALAQMAETARMAQMAPPAASAEAPSGALEEILAGLFGALLGAARVQPDDDFFFLGGHSLLAATLAHRVRELAGADLPVSAVFEAPTPRALAARLREAAAGAAPPIAAMPRQGAPRLSYAQQRLWFLDQLEPGSPAYNVPAAARLAGGLAPAVLARAFSEVVRRHEALRTTFHAVDGMPVQEVAPASPWRLPIVDLAALTATARRTEAERLARREARRPFDLARGPLLRTLLLRQGREEHLLLVTMHHIVSDGWSSGVMLAELAALVDAFAAGRPSPLAEPRVQYADWAAWQRRWLAAGALQRQLAHWRERLADAPSVLDLPTDRPRPPVPSGRGARLPLALPPSLTGPLRRLARSAEATPFMVFVAGFAALLHRLTGAADLLVGTPVANRERPELRDLIGLLANTLVLRADLSGEPNAREMVRRVRQTALAAYAHQDLPFELLVEALAPERSLGRNPLFQVMLAHFGDPLVARLAGCEVELVRLDPGIARFDLLIALGEGAPAWGGAIEYSTDLFDAATVRRFADQFAGLLAACCDTPDLAIAALPLLSAAERHQLAVEWSDTAAAPAGAAGLHEWFAAQAAANPGAPAVVGPDGAAWSYGELARRAAQVAGRLRELGVGPEVRVGVCLERRPELVASLLGVLWAGGAYVPLDPSYPAERVAFMLEDSGAAVLLTEGVLAGRLPATPALVVTVTGQEGPGAPPARVAPESLAYVIYTSGSSGRPKGVGIVHGGAVELVRWTSRHFSRAELSGVLAATSICFDLSVFELLAPLCLGGTVVLAENVLQLGALAARRQVRLVNTVPSAIAELARLGAIPESVTTVCLAGEPLRGALVDQVVAASRATRVLNLYGPSEDTTYTTWCEVARGETSPPIGRPLDRTRIYLVAAGPALVPVGVPGELLIGSASLARGYLGRPELTAERFVPDPFGEEAGGRLYRTGDLARWRTDGVLEFLGRRDHQVKVRGFRIELGEIESRLRACAGVHDAVATVREDAPGDRRLVAYAEVASVATAAVAGAAVAGAAVADAAAATVAELRESLRRQLPEHMVPSALVLLARLPRLPNGKVDRRALPSPRPPSERPAAPRTPAEELLCRLWEEVLGRDQVGIHDDFFALGGHSLLAARLAVRVRAAFARDLPLRALFREPTIAGLARQLTAVDRGEATVEIRPAPRDGALPLSFAQRRLWFLERLDPGSAAYNLPVRLALAGPLHPPHLAAALAAVVARHEALRTTFSCPGGEPAQSIAPPPPPCLRVVDLAGLPARRTAAATRRLADQEARRPFDLAQGPLLRALLVRHGAERHVLALTLHHIVGDGWSLGILARDLAALYDAARGRRAAALPGLPVQYADFAVWQLGCLQGEVRETLLRYWRGQLGGLAGACELPSDRPRAAGQRHRAGRLFLAVPPVVADGLRHVCRSVGATLFMTLLAVFQILLARLAGRADLVVGSPVANRNRLEIENLIGFFVNLLPLRVDLSGDPELHTLLARVREVCMGAYEHQDLPFELLVQELAPERHLGRTPLFQETLLLHDPSMAAPALTDLRVEPEEVFTGRAKFDHSLALAERDGGLEGWLVYDADLFDEASAARLLGQLSRLLAAAAGDPGRRLTELPMLGPEERSQLAAAGSGAPPVSAAGALLHQRFEALADWEPGAVALIDGTRRITRGELDRRSAALADRLRRLGVRAEMRVGVCLRRGTEMVVAQLAVLRAGGAFLPLDPASPVERLRRLVADAAAAIVLTAAAQVERLATTLGGSGVRVVAVDDGAGPQAGEAVAPLAPPPPLAPLDPLAYVACTADSAGEPRSVMVSHAGAVEMVEAAARIFSPAELRGVLAAAASSSELAVFELFVPLSLGGRVILADDLLQLPALPAAGEVTLVNTLPSSIAVLLRRGPLPLSSATVNLAAEPLPAALAERLRREPGVRRVLNHQAAAGAGDGPGRHGRGEAAAAAGPAAAIDPGQGVADDGAALGELLREVELLSPDQAAALMQHAADEHEHRR